MYCLFEKTNEKEAGVGPFFKKIFLAQIENKKFVFRMHF